MDHAAPGHPAGHREFTFGFNKKWELSQGLGLVESSQHKIFFLERRWGVGGDSRLRGQQSRQPGVNCGKEEGRVGGRDRREGKR